MIPFILFLISQLTIKTEIYPKKEIYYRGEPVSLKMIIKNEGTEELRIIPPSFFNENFKIFIYKGDKQGKSLVIPREIFLVEPIYLWKRSKKTWENISMILQPMVTLIFYFNLATLVNDERDGEFIYSYGIYYIDSLRYGIPEYINLQEIPDLSPSLYSKPLSIKISQKVIVEKPFGELKKIFDRWGEARQKVKESKFKDYSLYLEVLKICPDTCPYFPNILIECLNYIEPKRYWIKKFLNTYLYHPFAIKYISDKKWLEENVLPYGKEFIDSLPDKVKNEIYKTLKRKW